MQACEAKPTITLNFEQRQKLSDCPNCHEDKKFRMRRVENPWHPMNLPLVIYQCDGCGYWTNWFDGYNWYPPEMLKTHTKVIE